jgi:hypothetical protein
MPNLTQNLISTYRLPAGADRVILRDDSTPGFGVRVSSTSKAYILTCRIAGRVTKLTIGDARAWTLGDARAEARRLAVDIDRGIDPRESKKAAAAAATPKKSLGDLLDAYVAHMTATGKGAHGAKCAMTFRVHIPEVAKKLAAADIKPTDVAGWMRTLIESGRVRTAAILRTAVNAAYNAAARAELDPSLPAALAGFGVTASPGTPVPAPARGTVEAFAALDQLRAYAQRIRNPKSSTEALLYVSLFCCAVRLEQLARLTPDAWDGTVLTYSDNKGKRVKTVRLEVTPSCAAVLDAQVAKGHPYLFSADGEHRLHFQASTRRIKALSGLGQLTIRRGVETALAAAGVQRELRQVLLSHGMSGVDVTSYLRHDFRAEVRDALVKWERILLD